MEVSFTETERPFVHTIFISCISSDFLAEKNTLRNTTSGQSETLKAVSVRGISWHLIRT